MEEIRPQEFHDGRLERSGEYVVCFHATWCGFCREFLPEFRARERPEGPRLALADVGGPVGPLWEEFGLEVIPTLVAFRDGAPVARRDGVLGEGLGPADLDAMGLGGAPRRARPDR